MIRGDISELIMRLTSAGEWEEKDEKVLSTLRASYKFSPGFTERVVDAIAAVQHDFYNDFALRLSSLLTKVVVTGVAATIILAISVFLSGGEISLDSLLGFTNATDESIICLLTGN